MEQYGKSKLKKEQVNTDIADIKCHLKRHFIRAIKYHQTLEQGLQDNICTQVLIEISPDGQRLLITNRKPKKIDKYIYECDPNVIKKIKNQQMADLDRQNQQQMKMNRKQLRDDPNFIEKLSSASCNLDEIQGIIFGGVSSRFWMMRKHFSSLPTNELKSSNMALYAWQCITLQLKHREVDLVIRD